MAQRVCSPGAGFNPRNFVALWPTCVVLCRYVSSPVAKYPIREDHAGPTRYVSSLVVGRPWGPNSVGPAWQ